MAFHANWNWQRWQRYLLTKSSIEELFNEISARVFDLSSMLRAVDI